MYQFLKKSHSIVLAGMFAAFAAVSIFPPSAKAVEATTVPYGFMTWFISGGDGVSRVFTPLALPLVAPATGVTGKTMGRITAVGSNTLEDTTAGWTAGELSNPATPICIRITSGAAEGRTFLISTSTQNTADTVTLDSAYLGGLDLTGLGITTGSQDGDTYELLNCDTLSGLFGTPQDTGILGGPSANNADNVWIFIQGGWSKFYFDTDTNLWTKITLGSPDASNQPIPPDAGILYSRFDASPIELILLGRVPDTDRQARVNAGGLTPLGVTWPVETQLQDAGIENIGGWVSSANASQADEVRLFKNGGWNKYWYDGTNWRQRTLGSPIADTEPIPAGSVILIFKRTPTASDQTLSQTMPYTL